MANDYYDSTGAPAQRSILSSSAVRSEFDAIEDAFDKLPDLDAGVNLPIFINAAGTGLEAKSVSSATTLLGTELLANKDATGGYAGLTALKINFKNALNTVISFFTNSNTDVRTYTFQDRDGTIADNTDLALKSNLDSPTFTGTPAAPTAAPGTNTTQLATTAFVTTADNLKANIASPTLTGIPAVPTAAPGTNTTQIANTAFVAALGALKANLASPTFTGTPAAPTAAPGTNTTQLATTAFVTTAQEIDNQYITDGSFNIWLEGNSQTSSGYGSDTMWANNHNGTTKVHQKGTFTPGQTDVSGNPAYYSQTTVTSVIGAGNYCLKEHPIRGAGVGVLSGENATLSFWAKAATPQNIAIEFVQYFGTGGSPSAQVQAIGSQQVILTTSWVRYAVTVAIPSISGKTIGTNRNDSLRVIFWFDAGTDFNTRTSNLGQQNGTFSLAQVQLEKGSVATPFLRIPISVTQGIIDRYFLKWDGALLLSDTASSAYVNKHTFPATFSAVNPTITQSTSTGTGASWVIGGSNSIAQFNIHSINATTEVLRIDSR